MEFGEALLWQATPNRAVGGGGGAAGRVHLADEPFFDGLRDHFGKVAK